MHTQYYSLIKKNKIMPFAGKKLMEPGIITVSKINHTEKDKYGMFSLVFRI
jgi:hypothetical protein